MLPVVIFLYFVLGTFPSYLSFADEDLEIILFADNVLKDAWYKMKSCPVTHILFKCFFSICMSKYFQASLVLIKSYIIAVLGNRRWLQVF